MLSIARWIDMLIHVFMSTPPSSPSCFFVASRPDSAMKRYGLPSFRPVAPFCTDGAVQNVLSAARACAPMRACSNSFVMITYQLPIDMMTRMPSVIRATRSPPFHNASRPYGFSMISVVFSPTLAAGAGAGGRGWRRRCGRRRGGGRCGRRGGRRLPLRGRDGRRERRGHRAAPGPWRASPDGSSSTCSLHASVGH